MDDIPPGALHPPAEIGFLRIDEEAFVHEARALDRLAAREHERTGRPVARRLALVPVEPQLAFSERYVSEQRALAPEGLGERAQRVRKAPDGREQLVVGGFLLHARESNRRPGVKRR